MSSDKVCKSLTQPEERQDMRILDNMTFESVLWNQHFYSRFRLSFTKSSGLTLDRAVERRVLLPETQSERLSVSAQTFYGWHIIFQSVFIKYLCSSSGSLMSSTIVFWGWGSGSGWVGSGIRFSWLTVGSSPLALWLDFLQHLAHEKKRAKVLLAAGMKINFSSVSSSTNAGIVLLCEWQKTHVSLFSMLCLVLSAIYLSGLLFEAWWL